MLKINITYLLIVITWYILFIIFMAYLYFKYSRPYRIKNITKYYKKIPDELTPLELSMLIYHKITPSTLSATIVYLMQKGLIVRDGNILRRGSSDCLVSTSQNSAMELLFDVLGNGKSVDVNSISNFCHNNSNATDFLLSYDIWNSLSSREASISKQFFIQKTDYELVRWFQIIGYVLVVLNYVFGLHYVFGYVVIIPAYFILQYFFKVYKRTKKYNKQFYQWLGLGNYLTTLKYDDKLKLNEKAILIYSIILNKISHTEEIINGEQFITNLDQSLQKCYHKAFFLGNRQV